MDKKYDIVSIGDTTIDVFMTVDPEDTKAVCSLDEEKCLISFPYGAKIPVSSMARIAGVGNAANLAIGVSRLDLSSAIYTVLGSDKDSQDSRDVLESEGVSGEFVVMENGEKSNFSAVLNYSGERTIFVYHEDRKYNLPRFSAEWIYLTSVAKGHEGLHQQVLEVVRGGDVKLSFNPGSHQLRDGLEALKPLFEVCEALILNRDEAHMLVGGDLEDIKGLVKSLSDTGAKTVVITDGQGGSYATHDGREIWHLGIPESPVVERTGCGDAYSTGFLAAIIGGKTLVDAMMWGTMNATSVLQHVGAREGLLTSLRIKEFADRYAGGLKAKMI